ncbi:MAG: GC-type dockerin domain-anchored protein [Phycisphaerales bacterium]
MKNRNGTSLALLAAMCAGSVCGVSQAQQGVKALDRIVPEQAIGADGVGGPVDAPAKQQVQALSARLGIALPAQLPTEVLPLLDITRYVEEDAVSSGALREGVVRDFQGFNPAMGTWLELPGGGLLWVLDVKLPGSFGVRPHFSEMNLPLGAEMVVYDPRIPNNLPDPYVGRGPLGNGDFWAWTCWSDTARIEVYYPAEIADKAFDLNFVIDQVGHMYRNPVNGEVTHWNENELNCNQDVSCFAGWNNVRNCVGRMSFQINGGFASCSGAMVNNTSGDLTPYFMSARHCMEDNTGALSSLEVYWFFQTPSCNGVPPSIGSVPRSTRSTYVLTTAQTDMSMVMIEGVVPRNIWWTGTSLQASVANNTQVVGIHHPDGTFKRLSNGPITSDSAACTATGLTQGMIVTWAGGVTERGSSGSPLFLTNGAMVGVDSCGFSMCSDRRAWYGRWGTFGNLWATYIQNPGSDDNNENNDTCASATNLNNYFNGTLYSQIVKVNDEDWFRISVPALGTVNFNAVFQNADGDIDLQMFSSCGGTLLASSSGTGNAESISWTNPNNFAREVYLRTYLFNDTRNIYYLDFSRFAPVAPANNNCVSPQVLTITNQDQFIQGTTFAATTDGNASCGSSSASPDVWYRFTTDCSKQVTFSTAGATWDTVLSLHAGQCGNLVEIDCNDDINPPERYSEITAQLNPGTTYFLRVSGYSGGFGAFPLSIDVAAPDNDACTNVIELADVGSYDFSNCAATTDGPPDDVCLAFGSNQIYNDVWYSWYAPCEGEVSLDTFGSGFDTKVAIYAYLGGDSCPLGPNSALACSDDANAAYESLATWAATPGQRYIIRVGSYNQAVGRSGIFNLQFTPAAPYADDVCTGATDIMLDAENQWSTGWFTCTYATDGLADSCIGGDEQFYNDRWFAVTFPSDGVMDFNTINGGLVDSRIALYDTCPDGVPAPLFCNDDIEPGNPASQMVVSVGANIRYLLRIGNWAEAASPGLAATVVFTPTVVTCPGDYNNDTGVDGDDVIAFFADWDAGVIGADLTGDGGVDGDDVIYFFARWDAGC